MPDDIARAEERCMERLKSKIQVLETAYDFDTARLEEIERLQKQLEIAKSYLNVIKCLRNGKCLQCVDFAYRALRKIKELNK
jgi:hypothetical protein